MCKHEHYWMDNIFWFSSNFPFKIGVLLQTDLVEFTLGIEIVDYLFSAIAFCLEHI